MQNLVPCNEKENMFIIPTKTKSMVQPLDMYDFGIWIFFVRTLSNGVLRIDCLFQRIHKVHQNGVFVASPYLFAVYGVSNYLVSTFLRELPLFQ